MTGLVWINLANDKYSFIIHFVGGNRRRCICFICKTIITSCGCQQSRKGNVKKRKHTEQAGYKQLNFQKYVVAFFFILVHVTFMVYLWRLPVVASFQMQGRKSGWMGKSGHSSKSYLH